MIRNLVFISEFYITSKKNCKLMKNLKEYYKRIICFRPIINNAFTFTILPKMINKRVIVKFGILHEILKFLKVKDANKNVL